MSIAMTWLVITDVKLSWMKLYFPYFPAKFQLQKLNTCSILFAQYTNILHICNHVSFYLYILYLMHKRTVIAKPGFRVAYDTFL